MRITPRFTYLYCILYSFTLIGCSTVVPYEMEQPLVLKVSPTPQTGDVEYLRFMLANDDYETQVGSIKFVQRNECEISSSAVITTQDTSGFLSYWKFSPVFDLHEDFVIYLEYLGRSDSKFLYKIKVGETTQNFSSIQPIGSVRSIQKSLTLSAKE